MNNAMDTMTGLGGDWLVPSAFRIIPSTIAKRTNDVVEIKKKGAILMDDIASNRLMDELNWKGSVKESKLILMPVDCANNAELNKNKQGKMALIIVYR
jgi:hypothetical protein